MQSSPTTQHVKHSNTIKNVLLIDDTPGDIALTRRALARVGSGVHLEVLQDQTAILQRIESVADRPQTSIDLILIDLNTSKVDGYALIPELRKSTLLMHTPIVVISTSRDDVDVLRSYEVGANSYLHKATDFTEYAQTLYEVCAYWLTKQTEMQKSARLSK